MSFICNSSQFICSYFNQLSGGCLFGFHLSIMYRGRQMMMRTKRNGMENPQFPLKGVGLLPYITNLNEYSLSLFVSPEKY